MRWIAFVLATAPALPAAAFDYHRDRPAPKEGFSYPDCYCTNRGERVEMGQVACLRVGGRSYTARCAMSLNSPTWREVKDGCAPDGLSLAPATAPASPRHGRG